MDAEFRADATFNGVRFVGRVDFNGAEFGGEDLDGIEFRHAEFEGEADFSRVRFAITGWFDNARFASDPGFEGVWVKRHTVNGTWPPGWVVKPSAEHDGWAPLVRDQPEAETHN